MENLTLTDEEVSSLAEAILKRHGIDFTCYEPGSFKRRLIRAISVLNLSGVHELWMKILKEEGFMKVFMNEISVGLTSMFRDPILWRTLKKVLPKGESELSDNLSIWHAGCSSGEEVYTMGIVLRESGFGNRSMSFASDISNEALATAQRGIYHKIKLLEFEKNYAAYSPTGDFARYFRRDGEYAHFDTSLVGSVTFNYHNLISDPFRGKFDIIFCRNVMIYFDNAAKVRLMERFFEVLNPGGLMIVGFYDAVHALVNPALFELVSEDAKIYRSKTPVRETREKSLKLKTVL